MKHTFREHTGGGSLGTNRKTKITIEGVNNTETRKAMRGYWDRRNKKNGKSGCEIVIKTVDKETGTTITKIAVPLKVCAAMAARIVETRNRQMFLFLFDKISTSKTSTGEPTRSSVIKKKCDRKTCRAVDVMCPGWHVFLHLVLFQTTSQNLIWHLLPAPVIASQQYKMPPFSAEKLMDNKLFLVTQVEVALPHGGDVVR